MPRVLLVETAMMVSPSLAGSTKAGYLVESKGNELIVKLPVTVLDEKNANGRIYSTGIMEGAVERCRPALEGRRLLSTVNDHPKDPFVVPGEASHVVTGAWVENGHLWNQWEVLGTANGANLRALIEGKVAIGVSIRGLGSMDGYGNILEDYEYLGTDCVADPSARLFSVPERVLAVAPVREHSNSAVSFLTEGNSMKSAMELTQFLGEQETLLRHATNKTDLFRRAVMVESTLSAAQLPAVELATAINRWDQIKESVLNAPDQQAVLLTEQQQKSITELNEAKTALTAELTKIQSELTEKTAQLDKVRKANMGLVKKYVESVRDLTTKMKKKYNIAVEFAAKAEHGKRLTERKCRVADTRRIIAVQEAGKLVNSLTKRSNLHKTKYQMAVHEGAALLKTQKATAAKSTMTESKFVLVEDGTVRKVKVDRGRNVTAANQQRTVLVPGFI